ncbi:hypothetical protein [Bradyrhizobium sp. 170]|uniref:hypothetical protein n=1 Tax=Bradyrhizobium sp. 170 TaxID=2782641 RepID=UPI001FFEE41F|nr:hypothetical protein [Bradyrhizobium sp. 170]UPK03116.1 hypothetical protein IVB05_37160 [Bradyrhizobium sp. 170]
MPITILDGPTIPAGQSLSDGIDCSAGEIVRITIPQEYTPANMTFQVSSNGELYNDLYDSDGNEVTIVTKPDTGIVIRDRAWVRSIKFIKFRSGTRQHPVAQKVNCKCAIAIDTPEAAP